jgi:hypothetical protein
MASGSSTTDGNGRIAESEHARALRETVAVLESLLRLLFPDPPPLDIITVENVVDRYPLTGLGAPALAAIEQSQRILGDRGDNSLLGLARFHVGLIYLHWNDCRAAANQFALARQQWSLVGDNAALSLGHYAQGKSFAHAYHFEAAMLQYGRAERLLERPAVSAQAKRLNALTREMRPLLATAQNSLREVLWPKEQPSSGPPVAPGAPSDPIMPRQAEAPSGAAPETEPPPWHAEAKRPMWARRVPPPISNLPGALGEVARGPVPGHIAADDRFGWYLIARRQGNFLPGVAAGTWVLADREVDARPIERRLYVIVGSARAGLGSIAVQPMSESGALAHC